MKQIPIFNKVDKNRGKVKIQYTQYVCARTIMHVDEHKE